MIMRQFRTMFGFNNQMITYLKQSPINCIVDPVEDKGGIYLGNIYAAYSQDILKKYKIGAVLTVAAQTGLKFTADQNIQHMIIAAEDVEHFNLARHFDKMIDFIEKHKAVCNVFVHCFAGVSRSSTTVIAYLMKSNGWTYKKSRELCAQRRNQIFPNSGFVRQLINFEKKLKEQGIIPTLSNGTVGNNISSLNSNQANNRIQNKASNSIGAPAITNQIRFQESLQQCITPLKKQENSLDKQKDEQNSSLLKGMENQEEEKEISIQKQIDGITKQFEDEKENNEDGNIANPTSNKINQQQIVSIPQVNSAGQQLQQQNNTIQKGLQKLLQPQLTTQIGSENKANTYQQLSSLQKQNGNRGNSTKQTGAVVKPKVGQSYSGLNVNGQSMSNNSQGNNKLSNVKQQTVNRKLF